MERGETAFCVETDQGNVAWMQLTRIADADLTFRAVVWKRRI